MDDFFDRFPFVMRHALKEEKICFPSDAEKEFDDIMVYRGIRLVEGKKEHIDKSDFLSQVERKLPGIDENDIYEYSCSCFENIEELKLSYKIPRKNKAIAKGRLKSVKGCIIRDCKNTHINWFLYEGADPSEDFEVWENEKMDKVK